MLVIKGWTLIHEDGTFTEIDERITNFRGETHTLTGGCPPLHASSTGRVYTKEGGEFFPSVYNLRWVRLLEPFNLNEDSVIMEQENVHNTESNQGV